MCGLAGLLSEPLSGQEIDAFKDLMVFSTVRGWEGAGVATMRSGKNTNHARVWKGTSTGAYLVMQDAFKDVVKNPLKLIMGHTRWPTRGENKVEFCHPFREGHIVGMHNGTMHKINKQYPSYQESDSNFLFREVAKAGIEPVIKDSSGAYAIIWVDENQRTLNFLRNHDRPLFFAFHKTYNTVMWASEPGFLHAVIGRRWHGSTDWSIEMLPVNTLRSFHLKEVKAKEFTDIELKPELFQYSARSESYFGSDFDNYERDQSREFERRFPSTGPRPPFHQQHHNSHGPYNHRSPSEIASSVPLIGSPKEKVIDLRPALSSGTENTIAIQIAGEDRHVVLEQKDVIARMMNRGCMGCGNPGEIQDVDKVLWLDRIQFMCTNCQENPDWKHYLPGKPKIQA